MRVRSPPPASAARYGIVCGPSGRTQTRASAPAAASASPTVAAMSCVCSRWAAASSSSDRYAGVHHDARRAPGSRPGSGPATGRARVSVRAAIASSSACGEPSGEQLAAVGAVVGEAVAALGRADDQAARLDDLGRRRHALDGLVEVLVEREAGVRRDDDVERARAPAASPSARAAAQAAAVHREQLAGERLRRSAARG